MIKPINTAYRDHLFRSRLEARWAVYFDSMGIRWEYEKEGFEMKDGTRYLPDFWLDDTYWAEVKPGTFKRNEIVKVKKFIKELDCGIILLDGLPDYRSYKYISYPEHSGVKEFCETEIIMALYKDNSFYYSGWDGYILEQFPEINMAIKNALSARFEYDDRKDFRL